MKNVINCYKENNPVINKPLKEVSLEDGLKIATELLQILNKRKDGVGLAANQVGIDARVAVVNVREPLILINPEIISKTDKVPYYEGCLSFPGHGIHTERYETIEVKTEQVEGTLIFSGVHTGEDAKGTWESDNKGNDQELRLLESICVQHEIDHLNGLTIHHRKRNTTIKVEKKPGRNEPCHCGSGKKYKKCCLIKS
jgi:peptide deformylase